MKKNYTIVFFILFVVNSVFAICDFTVSSTNVCAGQEVTIALAQPYSNYHKIIVSRGIFPFLSNANANDYYVVKPYSLDENIVKIVFRGKNTIQDYTIQLAESNFFPNPTIPCNRRVIVRVNASPDANLVEQQNFTYCNETQLKEIRVFNQSLTKNTNTKYEIDWGDGSTKVITNNFNDTAHTYAVGDYTITYKVTGNNPSSACNISTTKYYIKIGGQAPIINTNTSLKTSFCAPGYYEIYLDTTVMRANTANTIYKFSVNGNVEATYDVNTLPDTLRFYFEEGTCGATAVRCTDNAASIALEAFNGDCSPGNISTCVYITDSLMPYILSKDTICRNEIISFTNGNAQKDKIINGTNCTDPNYKWQILQNAGYNLLNGNDNSTFRVMFTDTGTFDIKLSLDATSGACNDKKDTLTRITVLDTVSVDFALDAIICKENSKNSFVDVPIYINKGKQAVRRILWLILPDNSAPPNSPNFKIIYGNIFSDSIVVRFDKWRNYDIILNYDTYCGTNNVQKKTRIASKGAFDTLPLPSFCSFPISINPRAYFIYNDTTASGGDSLANYIWTFSNGTPNSQINKNPTNVDYHNFGIFPITLTINNVCGDSTLSSNINIYNNPKPDAGRDTVICGTSDKFELIGTPNGGIWRGNGVTDSILGIFDPKEVSAGKYTITYISNINSECPPSDSLIIEVLPRGKSAGPDQDICKTNSNQRLLDLVNDPLFPGGSWSGVGVVSSNPGLFDASNLAPDTYPVKYTYSDAIRNCKDTSSKNVVVFPTVDVKLNLPPICINQSFDFSYIEGSLIDADWDFGDGIGTANIAYPTYIYKSAGNYVIKLRAVNINNCVDSFNINVQVVDEQNFNFEINKDSSCTGNDIIITFPSDHSPALEYRWYFNSDSIISNSNIPPTISFKKPVVNDTFYSIKLVAKYKCKTITQIKQIKIKSNPTSNFFLVKENGCAPFLTNIINSSLGQIDSIRWNLGNGQTTNLYQIVQSPTYLNPNRKDTSYIIQLIVYNACASDTSNKIITVKANEVFAGISASTIKGCQPLKVDFNGTIVGANNFVWYFNDQNNSIDFSTNPSFIFEKDTIYQVLLIANGSCGTDTAKQFIEVKKIPKVDFSFSNNCVGKATQFLNESKNANNYLWTFGQDNTSSNAINPSFTYNTEGLFNVKLLARNLYCKDSIQKNINIITAPSADFDATPKEICFLFPIQFKNDSKNANNYIWYFGDNNQSNSTSPLYSYGSANNFSVSLVASNDVCRDSITKQNYIKINPKPVADFLFNIVNNDLRNPVLFTENATNAIEFSWNFGDGNISTNKNPEHAYKENKAYKVQLIVNTNKQCSDTIIKVINNNPSGNLYVPNIFAPESSIIETAEFKPKGNKLKEYSIQIFSTYGQLLWENSELIDGSPAIGWNGRYNGQLLPQDTYVWKIRAIFDDGTFWNGMKDIDTGKTATMGYLFLIR
jgi:PKD repeat protein